MGVVRDLGVQSWELNLVPLPYQDFRVTVLKGSSVTPVFQKQFHDCFADMEAKPGCPHGVKEGE